MATPSLPRVPGGRGPHPAEWFAGGAAHVEAGPTGPVPYALWLANTSIKINVSMPLTLYGKMIYNVYVYRKGAESYDTDASNNNKD